MKQFRFGLDTVLDLSMPSFQSFWSGAVILIRAP